LAIDPSTNLGKLRLRVADFGDIPYLPDSVYLQTLADNNDNLSTSAKTCAMYILGTLAFKTHRKMGLQLEVWGAEAFTNYKEFLLMTVSNPMFMDYSPIPYQSLDSTQRDMLTEFVSDWNKNYYKGTQSQAMAISADVGPNDGSRYGPMGSNSTSNWEPI
jgi:hypothetical protein